VQREAEINGLREDGVTLREVLYDPQRLLEGGHCFSIG